MKGLLKDRLQQGRERLEEAREAVKALCEPVEPPRDTTAYRRYFCAVESGDAAAITENGPKRVALYKLVAAFLRAYADLANEMPEAGYTNAETREIRDEVDHYNKVRQEVMLGSGDYVDLKRFEPDMRRLLDNYIRAEETEVLSTFEDITLVELIVERGEVAVEALPSGIRENTEAVAETIENNVRRLIIEETPVNPRYYERMSDLLDEIIRQRRQDAVEYREYLSRIVELTKEVSGFETQSSYPPKINTATLRALYDNLPEWDESDASGFGKGYYADGNAEFREATAIALDQTIRESEEG